MSKRRKYYDPDPRRKRHRRGHRKGVEPAGLKRWRLSHRRTHDPGRASSLWKGPRGGHYFRGPHKNRYDPAPRRRFGGARRVGGKLEHGLSKYGGFLGAGISALVGVYTGFSDYQKAYGPSAGRNYLATIIGGDIYNSAGTKIATRTPEISKLWGSPDAAYGGGPIDYLKYKFLGIESNGNYKGSAWVYPFWGGLIATLAGPIAKLFTHKGQRFLRPLHKIGLGLTAMSTVGALALPGCPKPGDVLQSSSLPNPPPLNQKQTKIGGAY